MKREEERRKLILGGDMKKAVLTISTPLIIGNIIQTLYNLADSIWVSGIGETPFAATGFTWPISFLFISVGLGLSAASTGLLSQLIGRNDIKEARKYQNNLFIMSFILGIALSLLGLLSSSPVLKLMGSEGKLFDYSLKYINVLYYGMPFLFIYFSSVSLMQSSGDTKSPTYVSGTCAVINAILDPVFIYDTIPIIGLKGFNMGVGGAALATVISQVLMAVSMLYIVHKRGLYSLDVRKYVFDSKVCTKLISVSVPASIGQAGEALGFIVLNSFIVSFGEAALTAFVTVNRITSIITQPPMGIGNALTSIIGQNFGVKNFDRIELAFKTATKITNTVTIFLSIAVWILRYYVLSIFLRNPNSAVMYLSLEYLFFVLLTNFCMGLYSIYQGVFQGTGHTEMAMLMLLGRLWVLRLPLVCFFKYIVHVGPIGIWIAMSLSNLLTALFAYMMFKGGRWKGEVI